MSGNRRTIGSQQNQPLHSINFQQMGHYQNCSNNNPYLKQPENNRQRMSNYNYDRIADVNFIPSHANSNYIQHHPSTTTNYYDNYNGFTMNPQYNRTMDQIPPPPPLPIYNNRQYNNIDNKTVIIDKNGYDKSINSDKKSISKDSDNEVYLDQLLEYNIKAGTMACLWL